MLETELEIKAHLTDEIVHVRDAMQIDDAAFQGTHDFVVRHARRLEATQRRVAMIRPDGLVGSVVAGFYEVTPAPYDNAVNAKPIQCTSST